MTGRSDRLFGLNDGSTIDRRTYLKGIGGTAAVLGAMSASGAATQMADYRLIEVSAGDSWVYNMEPGETLENLLIDITARNANFEIRMHGDNMTLRNVGIRGTVDSWAKMNNVSVSSTSSSSESIIENYYHMGYGDRYGEWVQSTGGTATPIFVSPSHGGDLLIRNVNLQNTPDNNIYASAPGNGPEHPATGAGGTVRVEDSFLANTRAGGVRLGTNGSYARNCVFVGPDDHNMSRPFWGYYNHTRLIDCDLSNSPGPGDIVVGARAWRTGRQAEVTVENTRFDTHGLATSTNALNGESAGPPQRFEPADVEGVPLSPEEAASGSSSSSGSSPLPSTDTDSEPVSIEDVWNEDGTNEIVLRSEGSAEYRFDGNGVAELGEYADTNADDPYRDTVSEDGNAFTVEGYLGGYRDNFTVEGEIVAVDVEGSITATVNGEEFDPEELEGVGSWDIDEGIESVWRTDEPNHVELNGGSPADGAEYRIDGNGLVETGEFADTDPDNPYTDTVTTDDDGFTIEGYVAGFRDDFEIEGAVTDVESNQELTAIVNGHEFDFEELAGIGSWDDDADDETDEADELPHELVIDGSGADGSTSYRFSVTGDLVSTGGTGSAADDASVDEQSAEGSVEDGQDSYRFSGNITGFWMAGEASIDLSFGE